MADIIIPKAHVEWRALAVGQDSGDPDVEPDQIPLAGVRVRLTPSPRKVEVAASETEPARTVTLREWTLITDETGTLTNPESPDDPIAIVASDAFGGVTVEWTSTISAPDTGVPDILKRWLAPAGSTVDLTTVLSVPPSPSPLPEYLAAVQSARAARDVAVSAAERADTSAHWAGQDRAGAEAAADRAETARDETEVISGLTGEDEAVALLVSTPASATRAAVASGPIAEATADRAAIPYARQITAANLRPLVSIYMDDAHLGDLTVIKPVTDAAGVPVTIAAIASYVDTSLDYMTAAQLRQVQAEGWQVDSHTHTHAYLATLTDEQIDFELRESRDQLRAMGLTVEAVCYPYGSRNARVQSIASRYYRAGLSSAPGTNRVPLRTHDLYRVHIPDHSLAHLKGLVDNIGVGWIVFYGHSNWAQADSDKLADLLAYIQSKSIDIVTVSDALDVYGNALEVVQPAYGDGDRFVVGADGRIYGKQIEQLNHIHRSATNPTTGALEISATTPITDFADGVVTTTAFSSTNGSGLPYGQGGAGTLITYRALRGVPTLGFQMFYPWWSTTTQAPAFRYWTVSGWGAWTTLALKSDVDGVPFRHAMDMNAFPSSAGYADFATGVTMWDINSSGSTGFPATSGTVTMYRSGQGADWSYQIFEQRVSAARFKRWMLSETSWSAWVSA